MIDRPRSYLLTALVAAMFAPLNALMLRYLGVPVVIVQTVVALHGITAALGFLAFVGDVLRRATLGGPLPRGLEWMRPDTEEVIIDGVSYGTSPPPHVLARHYIEDEEPYEDEPWCDEEASLAWEMGYRAAMRDHEHDGGFRLTPGQLSFLDLSEHHAWPC